MADGIIQPEGYPQINLSESATGGELMYRSVTVLQLDCGCLRRFLRQVWYPYLNRNVHGHGNGADPQTPIWMHALRRRNGVLVMSWSKWLGAPEPR
jgi:hypothetical protein